MTRALIDHSAWARLGRPALAQERREELARRFEADEIGVCLPFLLEAGYSARGSHDHASLIDQLTAFPQVALTGAVATRAVEAQGQLARVGHHRLPPVDLLIAALADVHRLAIIHYDADFDLILERTDLRFTSEWLAPRGSL